MSKVGAESLGESQRGRGRPKGSKNQTAVPDDLRPVGAGHNSSTWSDDDLKAVTYQNVPKFEAALGAKKKADADFKNVCREILAKVGSDAIDDIKEIIATRTPEGQAKLQAEVERRMKIARWSGMPVGAQANLFEPDRSTAEDRAHQRGFEAGAGGVSLKIPEEYAPSSSTGQAYSKGWHAGQESIWKIQQLMPGAPLLRSASIGDVKAENDNKPAKKGGKKDKPPVEAQTEVPETAAEVIAEVQGGVADAEEEPLAASSGADFEVREEDVVF